MYITSMPGAGSGAKKSTAPQCICGAAGSLSGIGWRREGLVRIQTSL